jgi:isopenicillin-N epimerase
MKSSFERPPVTRHLGDPGVENHLWGPDWPEVRALWPIDPSIAHLNHGSFGAVPLPVSEAQDRLRAETERDPTGFFWWTLPPALDQARRATAAFLGADPEGFVFVPNATTAANTVLASIGLRPSDEVMVTDHGYGALRLASGRAAERTGATLRVQPIPLPNDETGTDAMVEALLDGVTDRTRLVLVCQIASPTAVVFPIARIVEELRARGVLSFVDGAHAPGMIDVDLAELRPDFWTGNLHKWPCAPRGAGALYVAEPHRDRIQPLITSWNALEGFVPSFAWVGTADYTPYLCVPAALEFMAGLGWDRLRRHNRELAAYGRGVVREVLGTGPPCSDADGLFEAMTLVALPDGAVTTLDEGRELSRRAFEELRVEVAAFPWRDRGFLRLSAQAYNAPAEYDRLAEGLPRLFST